jgi:hypothetical protein
MTEEEILGALLKGANISINSVTGEAKIVALDDLSPEERECFRASTEHDWTHEHQCPDCLESIAGSILMDAASHRESGNEADALELEAEAAELLNEADKIRLAGPGDSTERGDSRTKRV